jgi:haloacetate dehalogenase
MIFEDQFTKTTVKTAGAQINVLHGGAGAPLLLLHGYPQTHVMWHEIAPHLMQHFHLICPDLRGYGDSSKPFGSADHATYSKREMAKDMIEVMESLGHSEFFVAGHDRGARVVHRMALDYPEKIKKACVMDIVPTHHMFKTTDQQFATSYYHWYFLIQPDNLPERMIGADPAYYLSESLKRWSASGAVFKKEAVEEYIRCFSSAETIHASCEDYRAAASIDLKHDQQDIGQKIKSPLLVLWGAEGFIERNYNVLDVWREHASDVQGKSLQCGHFLAEEAPLGVCEELMRFFDHPK